MKRIISLSNKLSTPSFNTNDSNMQDTNITVPQKYYTILSLPVELVDLVCKNLANGDLRSLRLACKGLEGLVRAHLFQNFTLCPHICSFEHLHEIASSPHLASHLQTLDYDTTLRGISKLIAWRLKRNLHPTVPGHQPEPLAYDEKEAAKEFQIFQSGLLSPENDMDKFTQFDLLQSAFAHLNGLKHIRIYDSSRWLAHRIELEPISRYPFVGTYGAVPHFYVNSFTKIFGGFDETLLRDDASSNFYAKYTEGCYALIVLVASQKLPVHINSVEVRGVSCPKTFGAKGLKSTPAQLNGLLSRLKTFELHSGTVALIEGRMTARLQLILKVAVDLEKLVIHFRDAKNGILVSKDMYNHGMDSCHQSIFNKATGRSLPARLTWGGKVQHLALNNLVCTSAELKSVLRTANCEGNLTELHLTEIVLMPSEECGPRTCFVNILKWMQRNLQLDKVCFDGLWSNGGMQNWSITQHWRDTYGDADTPQHLWDRVQRFVIDGGPCPLDHVKILKGLYDLAKPECSSMVPEVLGEKNYTGDLGWTMLYADEQNRDSSSESDSDSESDDDSSEEDTIEEDD